MDEIKRYIADLVKLSTKIKMNRYIDYPKEFEELLTTVVPQIYKM